MNTYPSHGKPLAEIEIESRKVYAKIDARGFDIDVPLLDARLLEAKNLLLAKGAELKSLIPDFEWKPGHGVTEESAKAFWKCVGVSNPPTSKKGKVSVSQKSLEKYLSRPLVQKIADFLAAFEKEKSLRSIKNVVTSEGKVFPTHEFYPFLGRVHSSGVSYMAWTKENLDFLKPAPGHDLVSADFSQIEMVIIAVMAGEITLVNAIKAGLDVHRFVASLVYECEYNVVTDEQRNAIKAISYGIIYGKTVYSLAQDLNISESRASSIYRSYFDALGKVYDFINETMREALKIHSSTSYHGRVRPLPELANEWTKDKGLRLAVNHRIQSTAGDVMRSGLIDADIQAEKNNGFVMATRHDQYLLSIPHELSDEQVLGIFKSFIPNLEPAFPLHVKVERGSRFTQMKKIGVV